MAQPPYDPYGSNPENAEGNAAFGQDSGSPYEQQQEQAAQPAPEVAPSSQPADAGQPAAYDPYSQPAADNQAQSQQSAYSQPTDNGAYSQPGAGYPGQDQQAAYSQPGQPGTHQAAYGQPGAGAGAPGAPYGYDPVTGLPYSEKSKLVAGLLGILLGGFGVGRFYTGHVGLGVAQLIVTFVTFGIGALWGFIDGIMMLAGNAKDSNGLPLRPN